MADQTALYFENSRKLTLLVAGVFGLMAVSSASILGLGVAAGSAVPGQLWLSVPLFLLGGGVAASVRISVRIDPDSGRVVRSRGCLGWQRTDDFALADFTHVGVASGASGRSETIADTTYRAELVGPTIVPLPGWFDALEDAQARAEEVADATGLELEREPKTAFFQLRF